MLQICTDLILPKQMCEALGSRHKSGYEEGKERGEGGEGGSRHVISAHWTLRKTVMLRPVRVSSFSDSGELTSSQV